MNDKNNTTPALEAVRAMLENALRDSGPWSYGHHSAIAQTDLDKLARTVAEWFAAQYAPAKAETPTPLDGAPATSTIVIQARKTAPDKALELALSAFKEAVLAEDFELASELGSFLAPYLPAKLTRVAPPKGGE